MAVRPAIADAEDEIGFEEGGVAIAVAGLKPDHAGHQGMVVGNRAPAHQRGDDRDAGQFGEFHQQVAGVGIDDPAAGDDQGPLRLIEHFQRLARLLQGRGRLVDRQRLVGVDVEFDLGHLHVERQVDQHRAGRPERIR